MDADGGDDLREPGADAGHRHPREPRRGPGALRTVGDPGLGDRPGDRPPAASGSTTGHSTPGGCRRPRPDDRPHRRSSTCSATSRARASATGPSTTGRSARPADAGRPRGRRPRSGPGRAVPGRDRPRRRSSSRLLSLPNIADSSWVWRQYDHQLFLNTVAGPGSDAAVLRLKDTDARRWPSPPTGRPGSASSTRGRRRRPGGAGGSPQRGLHRRPVDGPGQLPELRQPRAPRGDVAVRRSGGRDVGGLPGARPPGHRRQRQLLQRVRRRGHPPDPGRRRRRPDRPPRRPGPRRRLWPPGTRIVVLGDTAAELGGSEWAAGRHGLLGGHAARGRPGRRRPPPRPGGRRWSATGGGRRPRLLRRRPGRGPDRDGHRRRLRLRGGVGGRAWPG